LSASDNDCLSQQLHASWSRKLYAWWEGYNRDYLKGVLKRPQIRVGTGDSKLGSWDGERRILSISVEHIERDPWLAVMETLRHEMAHQFAQEILRPAGETPHGDAFRHACDRLRCSFRSQATREELASGRHIASTVDDVILRRLKKLLSLSASTNEHEAEVAMQKARHLLAKYNIDLVEADRERRFDRATLGPVKGRHTSAEIWLAAILSDFFFVEVLWTHSYDAVRDIPGTVLEVYGTPENLEMAEYVYGYLNDLLPMLWTSYRNENGLNSNRERQRFYAGVLEGFYKKLKAQDRDLRATRALVWKGDPQLRSYFRNINPRVHTRYGGGVTQTQAYRDGLEEGNQVNIHKPVARSSSNERRRLTA
jgi:hypothetical protein